MIISNKYSCEYVYNTQLLVMGGETFIHMDVYLLQLTKSRESS